MRRFLLLIPFLYALGTMGLWMLALRGLAPSVLPVNIEYWHAHELVLGFGFTLSTFIAIRVSHVRFGWHRSARFVFAALALAWLAGRLGMNFAGVLPGLLVAALDCLFPFVVAVVYAHAAMLSDRQTLYSHTILAAAFALCNTLYHGAGMGLFEFFVEIQALALTGLIFLLLLEVLLIAGLLIPAAIAACSEETVAPADPRDQAVGKLALGATVLTGAFASLDPAFPLLPLMAFLAAALHAVRLVRWYRPECRGHVLALGPLAAYFWFPVGFVLLGIASLGWLTTPSSALHALTIGAICFSLLTYAACLVLDGSESGGVLALAYTLLFLATLLSAVSSYGPAFFTFMDAAAAGWGIALLLVTTVFARARIVQP